MPPIITTPRAAFRPARKRRPWRFFVEAGALTPTSRLLEIGVGTGRIALPMASSVGVIYGVDIARPMLKKLYAKRDSEPLIEHVYVAEADGTRLPIPSGSIDAVVAVHIFHLIPAWRDVLNEAARVLRPGGLLLAGRNWRTRLDAEEVFEAAIGYQRRNAVGMSDVAGPQLPLEAGWQLAGEEHVHLYTSHLSPQNVYDEAEQRLWSRLWTLPDAQLEIGLSTLKAFITAKYPDPRAPIAMQDSFRVQAYKPPA